MDELQCINIKLHLLNKSKEYLDLIKNEYGIYMSDSQLEMFENLYDRDFINVDNNGDNYLVSQEKQNLDVPLAHGGRVFGDNKIHFYPFTLLKSNPELSYEEIEHKCEMILVHELLHYFIRPDYLDVSEDLNLYNINSATTEGIVDMCTRDLYQKYGLFQDYSSDYGKYVIFVRDALSNIKNVDERMNLIFNGSIEEIYDKTTNSNFDSREEFISTRDNKTIFDNFLSNISNICYGVDKNVSGKRVLYNFCANYKNKEESLAAIEKMGQLYYQDSSSLISQQVDFYRDAENISKQ